MNVETHEHVSPHGYIHRKDDYLKRLRRIEGQARGLQKMVEDAPHRCSHRQMRR
jgi:DNA-binding FrmR family transcriptional regulator